MKKSMSEFAKDWKSPEERKEMKGKGGRGGEASPMKKKAENRQERKVAAKEAKMAPPDTTKMKNSGASRGASAEGFTKGKMMKGMGK